MHSSYKKNINLVWFKRDLRTEDHEPLFLAERSELPYLMVFFFEPSVISYPDTSERHLQFQYHSILKMNKKLSETGHQIYIFYAEVKSVLQNLLSSFQINTVFSYRENGVKLTYDRDIEIGNFFRENKIQWIESKRDGILRGIKNREGWEEKWEEYVSSPIPTILFSKSKIVILKENPFPLPDTFLPTLSTYPKNLQPAGELVAKKYLESFIEERGFNYNKFISKPLESRKSCGRISPYLSWGNLSVRQVVQFIRTARIPNFSKINFDNFLLRVKWRSHFMQKFEMDCSYETKFLNSGFDTLNYNENPHHLSAWKYGMTGFPIVDACMKCLIETGWINFRMRAMLVSFATHNLFLDWRMLSHYLAQLFLDYEPGIHYPQIQMQAGTTGINLIRIYNPEKQSLDQDAEGKFIKKYIPELKEYPLSYIHSPKPFSEMEKILLGIPKNSPYPPPIIDHAGSAKLARELLYSLKKSEKVRAENKNILKVHTGNKVSSV